MDYKDNRPWPDTPLPKWRETPSPAPKVQVPALTQRAVAAALAAREVVLQRKLSETRGPHWVMPFRFPPDGGRCRIPKAPATIPSRRRSAVVPADTYAQLEDKFCADYVSVKRRLERALDRCGEFSSSYSQPAPPSTPAAAQAWHTPYPAGADLLAHTGDAVSAQAGTQAAAALRRAAEALGEQTTGALQPGSDRLPPASPGEGVGTHTAASAHLPGQQHPRHPQHIRLLLQQPRGLHAGSVAYHPRLVTAVKPVGTHAVGAPHALGTTSAQPLDHDSPPAPLSPCTSGAAPRLQHGKLGAGHMPETPLAASVAAAAEGWTPATVRYGGGSARPSPGGLGQQGTSTSPNTPSGRPWTALAPPLPQEPERFQDTPTKPAGATKPAGWQEPMALTFPESTNKFSNHAGTHGVAATVRQVLRLASSEAPMQGLTHRERLRAGIQQLSAEFFGPLC